MVAKAQSQTILLDDVFRAFLDDSPKVNYDRPGGDFKSQKTSNGDECKSLCASITKCVSYTFENGVCHLKSTAPPIIKRNTGCITGLITSHFVCNEH
jgi:PAN domain